MDAIRDFIEWIANDAGVALATLFPFLLLGLVGLYFLWLVIGYLRVSQIGLTDAQPAGSVAQLPQAAEGGAAPRGVPYCPVDRLQFPAGSRYCTVCERDLTLECVNCGATLTASDASCYRCGTPTSAPPALLG